MPGRVFPVVVLCLAALWSPAAITAHDQPVDLDGGPIVLRVYYGSPDRIPELFRHDVWEYRNEDEGYVLVQVDAVGYRDLQDSTFGIEIDLERTLDARRVRQVAEGPTSGVSGFPCYRTVEETYQSAQQIVASHPTLASWIDIGDSWDKVNGNGGYDLRVLKLTQSATTGTKPKLIITSSIHPREYAPAELSTRFAEYLVERYDADPDVTWILDAHEVHLMLQGNPDGRKQAETGLLWRKTTNQAYCSPASNLRGADLNRNFGHEWACCGGAANDPCDELYRGPSPFSEHESQAIRNYLLAEFPDWRGPAPTDAAPANATGIYLDNHAFGELIIWPWGYTNTDAPNGTALQTLGRKLAGFNGHEPKQARELYITDGTAVDYGYGEFGVASYTYEMGTSFFQDCADFEGSIFPKNLESLLYAAKVARAPYLWPAGPDAVEVAGAPAFVEPGEPVTIVATLDDTRFENSNGTEPTQDVVAAEAYVGIPPWDPQAPAPIAMTAVDGAFDAAVEEVEFDIDTTNVTGREVVWVRGQDALGNWGAPGAAFFYVADGSEGSVSGQVSRLSDGQPLVGYVKVDELNLTVATNGSGMYTVAVPTGSWTMRSIAEGYVDAVVANVVVGSQSAVTRDFAMKPIPPIILVDDDDNSPDVSRTITTSLDALGQDYVVWDTGNSDNEPSAEDLRPFETVIWFTGGETGGAAGPGGAGETALADWLDRSGCLLLSSQDYVADRGMTAFMGSHLGLASVDSSVTSVSAFGQGVFAGFGPYFLSFPYPNRTDRVYPDATATAAMSSGSDPIGISKDTGIYRTTFWGFGFEGIPGPLNHQALLTRLLQWCDTLTTLDGDSDGVDNGGDCHAGDPTAWSLPTPARDLVVSTTGFSWTAPLDLGGLAVSYDLLEAASGDFDTASCLQTDLPGTAHGDATMPAPGEVRFYLIRPANACGGNPGSDSIGLVRSTPPCH
jgi:murein tripeptide amidase MpaA